MFEYKSDENFLITLKTSGKSKNIDDFNIYEEFYNRFNEKPSIMKFLYENGYFDSQYIKNNIKKIFKNYKILYKDCDYSFKYKKNISKKEIWLIDNGFILLLNMESADFFYSNPQIDINKNNYDELIDSIILILPTEDSKYYNNNIIDNLINIFEESKIKENASSSIGMVAIDNGEFYIKDFNINNNFKLKNIDLHYGDGFNNFDKKLLNKLKKEKKGLVLLHGLSGTGKTYYIRYLLSRISKENKSILYFPPSMVGTIIDPNFVNFINTWVNENEKSCIILIEDAESLLISRDNENNIGITNLLNITDGILNDIFGIQVIATFNTRVSNLDTALLRPERLIARKEFKPLKKDKALILADKLKINNKEIKDNMTLADIYSIKKNNQILTHDINDNKKSIGFK